MPRLDQVANPTAAVALNAQKITGLANGTVATDAAAFGQLPNVGTTAVGGDLSGTVSSATVAKVSGVAVSGTPSSGQVLTASSTTAAAWSTQTSGAQALSPTAVKTSAYTAAAGDYVPVDISGGSVTVTLPTAPTDKTRIGLKVVAVSGTPGSTTLTIARGGSDVFNVTGGSTSLTLNAKFQGVLLQYASSSSLWYVQTTDTPLNEALGAALIGTDGTVGGPGGTQLSSSVVSGGSSGPPAWAASTAYAVNQLVTNAGTVYICNTAHTSASTFGADASNFTALGGGGGAWTSGSGPSGSSDNPVTSASATRPSLTVVYWQCSTQPTNLAAGDIWIKYP
jgi:hypothetical protein